MKALRTVGSYLLIGGFIGALMYLGNRLIDTIKTNFFSIELVLLLAGIYLACVAFGMLFFLIADTKLNSILMAPCYYFWPCCLYLVHFLY
ncbi:hypothetical protein [Ferdinandcohnia sp. Marseille-Q9671]